MVHTNLCSTPRRRVRSMSSRSFFVILLTITVAGRMQSADGSDTVPIEGLYVNHDYGYSVRIPVGFRGEMAKAPKPNHGFVVYLGNREEYISVYAEYNVLDDADIPGTPTGDLVDQVSKKEVRTAGLTGQRITYKHDGLQYEEINLNRHGRSKIHYSLSVRVWPKNTRKYAYLFHSIVKSFRILPIS